MADRSVLVLGGGVAGLAAALLLAWDGNRVTVVDRDGLSAGDDATAAPEWDRSGIPHFLQPHAFIPRGRSELRRHLPDVYASLLDAGAWDIDVRPKLGSPVTDADEELQYFAVRRPVIEWALRRAASECPGLTIRGGAKVDGPLLDGGRAVGARIDGGPVTADVVVDALGRRTPTTGWFGDDTADPEPAQTSDCGVVYYSRYYQCRDGFQPPDGPWFLSPRGDLGYMGYASFPGDNGTFAALFSVPPAVPEWKALRDADRFEAAIATVPALAGWANPEGVDPITPVMAMAGLHNHLRRVDRRTSVFPVGDAYGHTDPVLAHGLAFGLIHAAELARVLREHQEVPDALDDYVASTGTALRERYDYATALDEQRHRMWVGGDVDFAHHDADYALFTIVAGGAAATVDPAIARLVLRRAGLLDSTCVLDDDLELRQRIEDIFATVAATPRPRQGPTREEMLDILSRR